MASADLQITRELVEPSLLVPAMRRDLSMRALESQGARIQGLDLQPTIVYDFDTVPASALPYLAEQYGLYGDIEWELANTEAKQRKLLKNAMRLISKRGTPWALKEVFKLLGFGDVVIEEGPGGRVRGAGHKRGDGFSVRGSDRWRWSLYRVTVPVLITIDQAAKARRLAEKWAPARCHLHSIRVAEGARLLRNGAARRTGEYTRGVY